MGSAEFCDWPMTRDGTSARSARPDSEDLKSSLRVICPLSYLLPGGSMIGRMRPPFGVNVNWERAVEERCTHCRGHRLRHNSSRPGVGSPCRPDPLIAAPEWHHLAPSPPTPRRDRRASS